MHLVHLIHDYSAIDHIVLVDNLSPDGSIENLQKAVNNKIDVIQSDRNGGYSYGNNYGAFYLIEKYNIDILFIANPDVEFSEDFLIRVVSDMDRYNAQAASVYMDMPKIASGVVRNPKIKSVLRETLDCTILLKHIFLFIGAVLHKGGGVKQVEWIPDSLFAIDAKTYKELNGMDNKVFLFYEKQIFGWKFIQAGYKMVIDTDISYFHNHSVSINKSIKRYSQVKQFFHYSIFTRPTWG